MQRKSIGHSRRKQGAHGTGDWSKTFCALPGNPGLVNAGEVLPKSATTGVPSAAARCIGPVSFVSTTSQALSRAASSRNEVAPARLSTPAFWLGSTDKPGAGDATIPVWILAAKSTSPFPPKIIQRQFVRCLISRAAATKRSDGQRLAAPYSAPGFRPNTGCCGLLASPNFSVACLTSLSVTFNRGGTGSGFAPRAAVKCK